MLFSWFLSLELEGARQKFCKNVRVLLFRYHCKKGRMQTSKTKTFTSK